MTEIKAPYNVFFGEDGYPLEGGYIFIGLDGLNPLSNPQQAYWDPALTIPAANVRTSGGKPEHNGAAGRLYVPGDYSILVQDKNGRTVYSQLQVSFEYMDLLLTEPRGTLSRSARAPASFNMNSILESGIYTWTNGATTNKPATTAAGDLFLMEVLASIDGTGVVLQRLTDITLGPASPSYRFTRLSTDAGATWSTWVSASAPPIGEVYFRGPHDAAPSTKYPGTTWTDVSYEEADLGRRVVGNMAGAMFGGTPARLTASVAAGVPSISIVSGGTGYLSGGSGSINLIIAGACTTQMIANATVTAGVLTAINVTQAGAGYTSGALQVYDGVVGRGDRMQRIYGTADTTRSRVVSGTGVLVTTGGGTTAGGGSSYSDAALQLTIDSALTTRTGAETSGPWIAVTKYRRTA